MYCHNCGKPIKANAKFCQSCGTKIESQPKDLVAQKVEALDLSNDIAVNNDAQIEKSARWDNEAIHKVEPPPLISEEQLNNMWDIIKSISIAILVTAITALILHFLCGLPWWWSIIGGVVSLFL